MPDSDKDNSFPVPKGMNVAASKKLYEAAEEGSIPQMQEALNEGADLNARHGSGRTFSLMSALNKHHLEAAEWLLDAGANPNNQNRKGFTSVFYMVNASGPVVDSRIDLLLDYGADPDIPNLSGTSGPKHDQMPLHEGARKQKHQAIETILRAGADPFVLDARGERPLEVFSEFGGAGKEWLEYYEALPFLQPEEVSCKEDLFKTNDDGYCPLDNPRTWRKWPEIAERLKAMDDLPSKEELSARSEAEGHAYLRIATDARQLGQVIKTLNDQGETLRMEELHDLNVLDETTAGVKHIARALITKENLKENPLLDMRKDLAFVPPEIRQNAIPNIHQLSASFSRSTSFASRER